MDCPRSRTAVLATLSTAGQQPATTSEEVSGASRPPSSWSKFPIAIVFILGVEFAERLCYYTFVGTQKTWLQDRGYSNARSSSMNLIFSMLSYIWCFFGGWLASTSLGRFKTIVYIAVVYVVGTFVTAAASWPTYNCVPLYMIGTIVLIPFGTGGIKPNMSTIGADQIDPDDPNAEKLRKSFFQYFYLSINAGSIISHGFLTSTAISGVPMLGIDIDHGFFFTYMVAAGFMTAALLVFLCGKSRYRHPDEVVKSPGAGAISQFVRTIWRGGGKTMGKVALAGWLMIPALIAATLVNAFVHSEAMKMTCIFLDVAAVLCLVVAHRDNSWIGKADGVTKCLDCVPVLLVGNVFYGILESSVGSFFQSQACQMDTRTDASVTDGFQLSGDFYRLANPAAIVLAVPVLQQVIYPAITRRRGGKEISVGAKVTGGYMIAIVSQLAAPLLEVARRRAAQIPGVESRCAPLHPDGRHISPSDMSAFWMMIPYGISGVGEIMVYPVLQHYAYECSPPEMKSLMAAFCYFAMGALPNAMASGLSLSMAPLVPNDLNDGNLSLVYLINVAIGAAGILALHLVLPSSPCAPAPAAGDDADAGSSESESESGGSREEDAPCCLGNE